MVSLRRPSTDMIRRFLASQATLGFTYSEVGATATVPPAGYTVDHTRCKLGQGEEVFMEARDALRCREQFRLGWMEAWSPKTTIEPGDVVAIIARNLGLWWLNACRIVYVVEEGEPVQPTVLHPARCPLTPGRARRGSSSNGIGHRGRSGTISCRSPARTACSPGWAIRICGGFRSGLGGSRRRRCRGRSGTM